MSLTLHHCQGSRSFRAVWALEEMGLPYELVSWPFPPRALAREYLAVNPLGTVPFLIDGAVRMTESAAICQYLGDRYGPTSLAVQPGEDAYGDYLNWLHQSDATLTFPLAIRLRYSFVEPPERRLAQAVEDYGKFYLGRLRWAEACLADGREYLCAGRFTMADIAIGYALQLGTFQKLGDQFPVHVASYYQRLIERPAYQRALLR
ncbi:MAG: glutathione S-transferase [Alphaproteobacteria bacterium]|jgi:glutathione S-transferase|nr:glutathione S-transferase [Alphaproteobacteria bacterium]